MRNIDLVGAYANIYENQRAARNPDQSSDKKYDKVRGEKTPMPPRGDKRREDFEKWYAKQMKEDHAEAWDEYIQLDEVAPLIAGLAGKAAGALAGKAATGAAAKAGGGLAKAAGSSLGKKAISAGSNAVGNKVASSMSSQNEEYIDEAETVKFNDGLEGKVTRVRGPFKKPKPLNSLPKNPRGDGLDKLNKKRDSLNKFSDAESRNLSRKSSKNEAYKLEGQRRKDLDNRYGSKKEEAAAVFELLIDEGVALDEDSAFAILSHMSDEWFDDIVERVHKPGDAGDHPDGPARPVGVGGFNGKVGGLGRDYKGDKDAAKKKADAQYKADRKAAAKERRERRADGEADNPLQAG